MMLDIFGQHSLHFTFQAELNEFSRLHYSVSTATIHKAPKCAKTLKNTSNSVKPVAIRREMLSNCLSFTFENGTQRALSMKTLLVARNRTYSMIFVCTYIYGKKIFYD